MREITLEAASTTTTVAGHQVELLTYNGQFPGPHLRLVEGEQVRIRLVNRTGAPTNLHLHGLPIPPEIDDPRILVGHGRSRDYEFRVREGSAGIYWYHPHGHGSVGPQLFAGLAGPLTVETPGVPAPGNDVDEHILLLKDLAISEGRPVPHTAGDWLNGKEGNLVLVNGQLNPRIDIPEGRRGVRLRLINACNARYFALQVKGQRLAYLGAGIGHAETTQLVGSVLLAPGERADVAVQLEQPGDYPLVALPYDRGADMSGMAGGASANHHTMHSRLGNAEAFVLATISSGKAGPRLDLPAASQADAFPTASEATTRRRLVLSEEMDGGEMRFLINGRRFDPGRVEFQCSSGSTEIWEIVNEADMDHPFHVHVFPFLLLSRNGKGESVRMWRDTVNLAAGDRVEILLPLKEFTGTVMYHCHIVEHEDLGMMGLFAVL